MEQICQSIPEAIVVLYKSISSGGLLAFFGLILALLIPFAIFLIDGSNKTDEEKDFAKVERAVILKTVMHVPLLVTSLFLGGFASLLFIDDMPCKTEEIIWNALFCTTILSSIITIMWIIKDIIIWMKSSAKPDNIESFCFKKWKKYLEKLNDKEFYDTWNGIFSNRKLSETLQPAYLSIYFEKIKSIEKPKSFISYSVLYQNLNNINTSNPGVLKTIIDGIEIDDPGLLVLNKVLDRCNIVGDMNLLMNYLDEKLKKEEDERKIMFIINSFLLDRIRYFFDDTIKERAFVNAIPISWKLSSLIHKNPSRISKTIAKVYPSLVLFLLNKQSNDNNWVIELINAAIIGNANDELDESLLADCCEIYDNPYRIVINEKEQTPEQRLIENYLKLETRYFANSGIYYISGNNNEIKYNKQVKRQQEANSIKILMTIFPNIITNETHIANMKKEIKKQLKEQPNNYKLERLSVIYKILSNHLSS